MTASTEQENNNNHKNAKESIRKLEVSDVVKFHSLPQQYIHRTIRDGIVFNLMVIGATGVGKSTLIDSLFNIRFPDNSVKNHHLNTVDLNVQTHELQEKALKLKLSVIETRGFGDQINKNDCFKGIVSYLDAQFEKYLQEELKINRSNNIALKDSRVHCCLYLISPVGHGLRAVDLITMKALHTKVNLIPVIAKADIITKNELSKFRSQIMSEIKSNGIQIYQFPNDESEISSMNREINAMLPFAVVASHDFVRVGNKQVRARQYPWGTVQVENEAHCDFTKLKDMLIRCNNEDLRDTTHSTHYELYRRIRLEEMGFGDSGDAPAASTFQETFEARRNANLAELKRKEDEMRQAFVTRVKEKEAELKEDEKKLHAKFDILKKKHQDEKKKLEDDRKKLEEEMAAFNLKKTSVLQAASVHSNSNLTLTLGKKTEEMNNLLNIKFTQFFQSIY